MPVVSSIFLVIALVMAVVIGPQTRAWTWGPAMLALGLATLAAGPVFWRREKTPADFGLIAFGTLVAGWFAFRAWVSPVAELGQADLLLTAAAVATYVCIRAIEGHGAAERLLIWGIALLLLANVVVAGMQVSDPTFTPVFRGRAGPKMVSGFYAHYNEAANYFIASSMLVGAAGLFGRHATATRVLWVLIAVAGLACVWFTRSRGGIFGVAVGAAVFAVVALMMGKRQGARWFGPALIAVPVIGLAIGAFLFVGWQNAQESRQPGSDITQMMDNTIRLYLLGIAMSCVASHPLIGGGSRSFSWECYQIWDPKAHGAGGARPEFVHNEWVQAAADYGLIGAVLLMLLLVVLAGGTILRLLFDDAPRTLPNTRNAWRLGALAGLAGMFVQSNFSFVFHLMPGILLLGICLGQLSSHSKSGAGVAPVMGSRILLSITALGCGLALLASGWKGTQVTRMLWPSYFSKSFVPSTASTIDALSEAMRIWPAVEFYTRRAASLQQPSAPEAAPDARRGLLERALGDYEKAGELQPKDPAIAVNHGNLLSFLGRDAEAEARYANAVLLQGGMEPAFNARLSLARHLLGKGIRQMRAGKTDAALDSLETAVGHVEYAAAQIPPWIFHTLGRPTQFSIHEGLGLARELLGDYDGAFQAYAAALAVPRAPRSVEYRIGLLHGKLASQKWAERKPSEALGSFLKARQHIAAASDLPEGIPPARRVEYLAYLDRTIAFLKAAKVVPAE